ncbi:DUF4251 domain-containing protein [Aquimarina celericrescens]|uniref:DUF4251 domain-containing protein n=1 Tax=Aquimarina celericrescens TaxID=1964542 RepID=A0ABW5AR74_9FLAO|nr:DUF4251 domain-containing protein [Aquimarina celericrescens]
MKKILILILGSICIGCSSTKDITATPAQIEALNEMIRIKEFQIESRWAYPLVTNSLSSVANSGLLPPGSSVNNIDLVGDSNYFKMIGDSISMYLPYFGERRVSGNYNSTDTAIKYNNKPDQIEVKRNDRNQTYEMRFKAKSKNDTYDVFVKLFPNLTAMIFINSIYRTTISYKGEVSKLSLETKDAITDN